MSASGTPKASVLPEPVGDWTSRSWPSSASRMTISCTGNGSVIDRARSASTTDLEVPRSANVAMSVLLELTSSGRSSDPGSAVHVEEQGSLGRPWGLLDFSTVADFPAWDCDLAHAGSAPEWTRSGRPELD